MPHKVFYQQVSFFISPSIRVIGQIILANTRHGQAATKMYSHSSLVMTRPTLEHVGVNYLLIYI